MWWNLYFFSIYSKNLRLSYLICPIDLIYTRRLAENALEFIIPNDFISLPRFVVRLLRVRLVCDISEIKFFHIVAIKVINNFLSDLLTNGAYLLNFPFIL
jgi:hypothetical protein